MSHTTKIPLAQSNFILKLVSASAVCRLSFIISKYCMQYLLHVLSSFTSGPKNKVLYGLGIAAILLCNNQAAMSQETTKTLTPKIRIASNGGEAVIALYDNPVSRNFALLLPLSVTFRDYAGEEKIADIPRKLATAGGLTAKDVQGDFTYYAPWGNLAVFYKGHGKDERLYILGRIESGKEWLAGQRNNFTARIEVVSSPPKQGNKREKNEP